MGFECNQVCFARHGGKYWYPVVVVDPDDKDIWGSTIVEPKRDGWKHILWLGSGQVSMVEDSSLRDFCKHFSQCVVLNVKDFDSKYLTAISLSVKLAAVRSGYPNPDKDWYLWGTKNLSKLTKPLLVTAAFYSAVLPKDNENKVTKMGNYVWVKAGLSESFWPGMVLPKQHWRKPDRVGVVIMNKDARIVDVEEDLVFDFCKTFDQKKNAMKKDEDADYKRALMNVVNDIRTTVEGEEKLDAEMGWFEWGRKNLPSREGVCASQAVREFYLTKHGLPLDTTYQLPVKKKMKAVKSMPHKRKHVEEEAQSSEKGREKERSTTPDDPNISDSDIEALARHHVEMQAVKAEKDRLMSKLHKAAKSPGSGGSSPKKSRVSICKKGTADLESLKVPLDKGWIRILTYRKTWNAKGKKGDIYYKPPVGKMCRSGPDVEKHFQLHGSDGMEVARHFSFNDEPLDHPLQEIKGQPAVAPQD